MPKSSSASRPVRAASPAPVSGLDPSLFRAWRLSTTIAMVLYAVFQALWIGVTPVQRQGMPDKMPAGSSGSIVSGTGPDEPQHYLYILSVAEGHGLPRPDSTFRSSPDQYVTYVAQHPPLFYVLAAAVRDVVRPLGDRATFYALRILCSLLGLVALWFISRAALVAFPGRPFIPIATPLFVAFLPMFDYMTSVVSNVPLELALTSYGWLLIVEMARGRRLDGGLALRLALVFGLALATRLTSAIWLPLLAVALFVAVRRTPVADRRGPILLAALVAGAVCLSVGLWSVHSQLVYGSYLFRWPYRPVFAYITVPQYLANPHQMVHTFHSDLQMPVPPLTVALWNASTSWVPFWLAQYSLPGYTNNPAVTGSYMALFLIADVLGLTLLLLNWLHRRDAADSAADPAGRLLLWMAGGATLLVAVLVVQQQFWVDIMMIPYGGRYSLSAVAAGSLVFIFALSTRIKPALRSAVAGAAALGIGMALLDFASYQLVLHFYASAAAGS